MPLVLLNFPLLPTCPELLPLEGEREGERQGGKQRVSAFSPWTTGVPHSQHFLGHVACEGTCWGAGVPQGTVGAQLWASGSES